jgi:hypothetical protein
MAGGQRDLPAWIRDLPDTNAPPWLQAALAGKARRPGRPVDPPAMMRQLTAGLDAITAARRARDRRNARERAAGWRAYQAAWERYQAENGPARHGPVVAALFGPDGDDRPVIF